MSAAQWRGGSHRGSPAGSEKMAATRSPRAPRLDLEKVDYQVREFTCKGCSNECDIRQFTIGGEKTYWATSARPLPASGPR